MTPLRQRFIEDMQLRNLAPTTQRSYLHYTVEFSKFYNCSPEKLDLEAVRQYHCTCCMKRNYHRKAATHSYRQCSSYI
jgi:hypothetical protein